jgi:hypothetical protein
MSIRQRVKKSKFLAAETTLIAPGQGGFRLFAANITKLNSS